MYTDGRTNSECSAILLTTDGVMLKSCFDLDNDIAWEFASLATRATTEPASLRVQGAGCMAITSVIISRAYSIFYSEGPATATSSRWPNGGTLADCVDALLAAMCTCRDNCEVQQSALNALYLLVQDSDEDDKASSHVDPPPTSHREATIARICDVTTGLECMIAAMRRFPWHVHVHGWAFGILQVLRRHFTTLAEQEDEQRVGAQSSTLLGVWDGILIPRLLSAGLADAAVGILSELLQLDPVVSSSAQHGETDPAVGTCTEELEWKVLRRWLKPVTDFVWMSGTAFGDHFRSVAAASLQRSTTPGVGAAVALALHLELESWPPADPAFEVGDPNFFAFVLAALDGIASGQQQNGASPVLKDFLRA